MADRILKLSNSHYTNQELKEKLDSCIINNMQYTTIYAGNCYLTEYGLQILCDFIQTQKKLINLALWKTRLTQTSVAFLIPISRS